MPQGAVGRGQRLPPGPGEDLCLPPKSDRVLPYVLGEGAHKVPVCLKKKKKKEKRMVLSVRPGPQRRRRAAGVGWGRAAAAGGSPRGCGARGGAGKPEQGWWMGGKERIFFPN